MKIDNLKQTIEKNLNAREHQKLDATDEQQTNSQLNNEIIPQQETDLPPEIHGVRIIGELPSIEYSTATKRYVVAKCRHCGTPYRIQYNDIRKPGSKHYKDHCGCQGKGSKPFKYVFKNSMPLTQKTTGSAIDEKKDKAFSFGIAILDKSVEEIHRHTVGSYKQISAIAVLDLAYVFAYGGLPGTAHYVFDLSPSGSGKDSSAEKSYELFLKPVMQLQNERKTTYEYERQANED